MSEHTRIVVAAVIVGLAVLWEFRCWVARKIAQGTPFNCLVNGHQFKAFSDALVLDGDITKYNWQTLVCDCRCDVCGKKQLCTSYQTSFMGLRGWEPINEPLQRELFGAVRSAEGLKIYRKFCSESDCLVKEAG